MKAESEMSGSEMVLKLLGVIWTPAVEAFRVQEELDVRSLAETSAAAGRAGYEVCYADLPAKVSGFAMSIAGKPHIVVNRAKSPEHQQYTVPHELGHHVLHLNPSRDPDQPLLSVDSVAEFQAHMFAAAWVIRVTSGKEQEDLLKQNPELSFFLLAPAFMTGGILVVGLLACLWSRLRARLSRSVEEK